MAGASPKIEESNARVRRRSPWQDEFRNQFRKTQLCRFNMRGRCRAGANCGFAHAEDEMSNAPDLTKTSICVKWKKGTCPFIGKDCPFAHGKRELNTSAAFKEVLPGRDAPKQRAQVLSESDVSPSDCSAYWGNPQMGPPGLLDMRPPGLTDISSGMTDSSNLMNLLVRRQDLRFMEHSTQLPTNPMRTKLNNGICYVTPASSFVQSSSGQATIPAIWDVAQPSVGFARQGIPLNAGPLDKQDSWCGDINNVSNQTITAQRVGLPMTRTSNMMHAPSPDNLENRDYDSQDESYTLNALKSSLDRWGPPKEQVMPPSSQYVQQLAGHRQLLDSRCPQKIGAGSTYSNSDQSTAEHYLEPRLYASSTSSSDKSTADVKSSTYCSICGTAMHGDDVFCIACSEHLTECVSL